MQIRSIHPQFFRSRDIDQHPYDTQRTFIGLWGYCDDKGRGLDDTALIKADVWPIDKKHTEARIETDLRRLEKGGQIERYIVDGTAYLRVRNWPKFQHPRRPRPSGFPPSPEEQSRAHRGPGKEPEPGPAGRGEGSEGGEEWEWEEEEPRESSSQTHVGGPPDDDDQRSQNREPQPALLDAVWTSIAEAELRERLAPEVVAGQGIVGDPGRWLTEAAARAAGRRADAAAKLAAERPDWPAHRIAVELEPALFANNPALARQNALESARNFGATRAGLVDADEICDEIASRFGDDELRDAALAGWREANELSAGAESARAGGS